MRLSARGFTLPWQLVELQEPGPVYLLASAGGAAERPAWRPAHAGVNEITLSQTTAHRSVQRLASGQILIRLLGWRATPLARALERLASEIFILPADIEVNERKWKDFLWMKTSYGRL
jgi:hypothetical protein